MFSLDIDLDHLSKDLLAGNRRALARAISVVEDGGPDATKLVKSVFSRAGHAHVIGITGSPGVGKSTLVDALISGSRKDGKRVGVLAIDPSSPFTGGAILGDRIRMQGHTLDKSVFIRSIWPITTILADSLWRLMMQCACWKLPDMT